MSFELIYRKKMLEVQAAAPAKLRVLIDKSGQKMAEKLYTTYISQEDMRSLPQFIHAIDQMLIQYGAQGEEPEPDSPEANEDPDE